MIDFIRAFFKNLFSKKSNQERTKLMIGYHVTTQKKLDRYKHTGCILEPVRFWSDLGSAKKWGNKTGRALILKIEILKQYPISGHKPRGHAWWIDQNIYTWERIN